MNKERGYSETQSRASPVSNLALELNSSKQQQLKRMQLPIPNQTDFSLLDLVEALEHFGGTRDVFWKSRGAAQMVAQVQQLGERLISAVDKLAAEQNADWVLEQYTQLNKVQALMVDDASDVSTHNETLRMCVSVLENCREPQQRTSLRSNLRLHFAYLMDTSLCSTAIRKILIEVMTIDPDMVGNATFQLLARRNSDLNDHEFLDHFKQHGGDPASIRTAAKWQRQERCEMRIHRIYL